MNMPYMAKPHARVMSATFHIRKIPRRRWTMMEWTKAVRGSQGSRPAFSTGSQPQ
jgi:hypothetical protein